MRFIKFTLVLIFLLSISLINSFAQDDEFVNDPTINEDANACLAGGSMEGKCNFDSNGDGIASDEEIEWAWTCGWYLIRWENGMIPTSSFPSDCSVLLGYIPNPLCIWGFIFYNGIANETGNVVFYNGEEGGCSGEADLFLKVVIVQSDTVGDAQALCTDIFGDPNFGILVYKYPGPEENLWLCFGDVGV